jgi:hypothetical protein
VQAEHISHSWRRYLRFSVRGLTVLVLVIGVWLAWLVRSAHIQRDAVAAITHAGGKVSYDWEWSNGNDIPGGKPWAPSWLVSLIGIDYFGNIARVTFTFTGRELPAAHVARLTRLQRLVVYQSPFGDAGVAHLKGMRNLSELGLIGTQVTDAGLVHLKDLKRLAMLQLSGVQITDGGLEHLKGLTNLSYLTLGATNVTDAGLENLNGLTNLAVLDLSDTGQITDAGLVHLKRLTNLSELNLSGTRVSDAGLARLKGLTNLHSLGASRSLATDEGLKALQQSLPNLTIFR